jgi:katanin p60 ATPase-containing subunit A1
MSYLNFANAQNIRLAMSNRQFIPLLFRDIIRGNPDVKWESIKGLETAKRLLKEAVVMPIKYLK